MNDRMTVDKENNRNLDNISLRRKQKHKEYIRPIT